MKKVLLFDVNESLLDLRALLPHFERVFGDGQVLYQWFGQVLHSAMLTVITDAYSDFGKVARAPRSPSRHRTASHDCLPRAPKAS